MPPSLPRMPAAGKEHEKRASPPGRRATAFPGKRAEGKGIRGRTGRGPRGNLPAARGQTEREGQGRDRRLPAVPPGNAPATALLLPAASAATRQPDTERGWASPEPPPRNSPDDGGKPSRQTRDGKAAEPEARARKARPPHALPPTEPRPGTPLRGNQSLIRFLPVMPAGCSSPMTCRTEGATSARMPSSTLASLFSDT